MADNDSLRTRLNAALHKGLGGVEGPMGLWRPKTDSPDRIKDICALLDTLNPTDDSELLDLVAHFYALALEMEDELRIEERKHVKERVRELRWREWR